ncbi:MAG: histidine kinase [Bacillota bacterium]|nr:histidine kinase [Bacillota bacterium]
MSEYDKGFERFLLLNDIYQTSNLITQTLHAYILDKEDRYLDDYLKANIRLIKDQSDLNKTMNTNDITLINYKNMIDSLLHESDETVDYFQKDDINQYSNHYNEVLKIADFLQESTLALLNNKLTDYQKFYNQMESENYYYKLMSLFLLAAAFFLSTLLAFWISGGITKPISMLSEAAKQISKGNLSGNDIKVKTNDELRLLAATFNQMRRNLRRLVKEIKHKSELDKLLKELELKSLQNQINPHFLFNTLNTVSKMAYLENAEQTSRLIVAIAAMLRYNLGDLDKPSTLRDEVRIVQEYFYIQQTRFGERIQFVTEIQDDCLDIEIPRLILQPLIENAFIHGVESYEENAEIRLHIYRKENQIFIEIIDNGDGMDEMTKKRLLQYMEGVSENDEFEHEKSKGHSTGIGVRNVVRRMQLFYHRNNIIEIDSELKKGTNFRLKIPEVA